jgi:hypothetical protein
MRAGCADTVQDFSALGYRLLRRLRSDDLNGLDGIVRLRSGRSSTVDAEILIKISGG